MVERDVRPYVRQLVRCLSQRGVRAEASISTATSAKLWIGNEAIVWLYTDRPPRARVKLIRNNDLLLDDILVCLAFVELKVEGVFRPRG